MADASREANEQIRTHLHWKRLRLTGGVRLTRRVESEDWAERRSRSGPCLRRTDELMNALDALTDSASSRLRIDNDSRASRPD